MFAQTLRKRKCGECGVLACVRSARAPSRLTRASLFPRGIGDSRVWIAKSQGTLSARALAAWCNSTTLKEKTNEEDPAWSDRRSRSHGLHDAGSRRGRRRWRRQAGRCDGEEGQEGQEGQEGRGRCGRWRCGRWRRDQEVTRLLLFSFWKPRAETSGVFLFRSYLPRRPNMMLT